MNQLTVRDALTSSVKRVTVGERPGRATPAVFAVFESDDAAAPLRGLVSLEKAAGYSQRIFADLLPKAQVAALSADASLEATKVHWESDAGGALPVVDANGGFVGAVTRESFAAAMLAQQSALMSELATREAQQRAVLNAIPDELLCVGPDGKLLPVPRDERVVDGTPTQGNPFDVRDSGKLLAEVFPPDVAATLAEGVQRTLAGGRVCHASFSLPGPRMTFQYYARFVPWGSGNVLVICHDVTELNALRAKVTITDRLVSIGTLAAGVAHEINNPLTYISANLTILRDLLALDTGNQRLLEAAPLLADLREGVDRVQHTVRDLKLFARTEETSRAIVDLRDVVARVVRMAGNEIRHRARLSLELGPIPPTDANQGQLAQVVLNLLLNATQSMRDGAAELNTLRVVTRTGAEGEAVIEVHDTGMGIPDEIKTRIFAPFFTTKGAAGGTGLGLSICHGIVMAHGGQIEFESTVGRGSLFRVTLPASTAVPAPPPPQRSANPSVGPPQGRFLLIDDESAILTLYRRLLQGAHCTSCSSGQQALSLLQRGERYDAVLCDLMMPHISGIDVYEQLFRMSPAQADRLIFVTGGAFTERTQTFLAKTGNPVLHKPFDAQRLFAKLADVMAQPTEATG